jgi:hypothetical protein
MIIFSSYTTEHQSGMKCNGNVNDDMVMMPRTVDMFAGLYELNRNTCVLQAALDFIVS